MANEEDSKKFNDFAIAFLKEAKEDLEIADILIENKKYARVIFNSQQAVEKSIKSLLEMEKIFVAEHDMSSFFVKFIYNNEKYKDVKEKAEEILDCLTQFEGKWKGSRYPSQKKGKVVPPTEIYDKDDAEESLNKANRVNELVKEILLKKFKLKI